MADTVETILDTVLLELGFGTQSAYAAAATDAGKRVFYLMNREARVLSLYEWQALKKTASFTMVASTFEYSLPSDWRQPIRNTAWDNTGNRRVNFPTDNETWAWIEAYGSSSGNKYHGRIRDGKLEFQEITADDVIEISYISDNPWQATGGGAFKANATADTDEWQLDTDAIVMGTKWRLLKAQGYDDWRAEYQDYLQYVNGLKGLETGLQTIDYGGGMTLSRGPFDPTHDEWV